MIIGGTWYVVIKITISYYLNGNTVYCFTNGVWRHNFKTQLAATLRIAGRESPAKGKLFVGDREKQIDIMRAYFKAVPQETGGGASPLCTCQCRTGIGLDNISIF
jgi:hypothetical protein